MLPLGRTAGLHQLGKEFCRIHPVRGIVRAGIDAARLGMIVAKVAGGRLLLHRAILRPGCAGSSSSNRERMHVDVAVGAVLAHRPQPMHQSSMMTSSELRRRIEPTGQPTMQSGSRHCRHEVATRILVESQPLADQARDAVVRVGAGADALVAARAASPDRAPAGSAPPSGPGRGTDRVGTRVDCARRRSILFQRARWPLASQSARGLRGTASTITRKSSPSIRTTSTWSSAVAGGRADAAARSKADLAEVSAAAR